MHSEQWRKWRSLLRAQPAMGHGFMRTAMDVYGLSPRTWARALAELVDDSVCHILSHCCAILGTGAG
ncbi:MAG: hypothetical protein NZ699_17685 [Roseiflexus sp.]|nr:hypothetical protein [Roseiflexus sp.]MCS7290956.1 hypothetical protein [Roseiflexus sp.]MDW8147731.1 hypothetical protein [Roseiflexaceae bacterium]